MVTPFERLEIGYELALKDVENYKALLEEQRDDHQNEIRKLYAEINDLKEQLALDKSAFSLINVLRNNGDTIVVAEREAKVIAEGIRDLNDRSETLHLHLSMIAKDMCQKLDDVRIGMSKRNEQLQTSLQISDQSQNTFRAGESIQPVVELSQDDNSVLFKSCGDSSNPDTSTPASRANSSHVVTAASQADSIHLVNVFREEAGLVSFRIYIYI